MITDTTGVFKLKELEPLEMCTSRYIMGSNGLFYEQKDTLFHACSEIHKFYRDVNFGTMKLLEQKEFFIPQFPQIPSYLLRQCLGFFRYIEDKFDCECGLVLLYDPDKQEYQWLCPEQEIARMDLKFTMPVPGRDYSEQLIHFGDVHLHPGMAAYHSHTDVHDEETANDGLHLVIGTPKRWGRWNEKTKKMNPDTVTTEYCAIFTSDGARFKVAPEQVYESLDVEPGAFPKDWLKRCTQKKETKWSSFGFGGSSTDKEPTYGDY